MDGARDLAQALGPDPELAQVLETGPDLDRAAGRDLGQLVGPGWATVPGWAVEAGLAPAAELVRAQTLEQSRPQWAGGSLPRHY